jgi:signal transduction histidine kinase
MADAAFQREHQQLAKALGSWLPREAEKFLAGMRKKGRSMIWLPERADIDATQTYATTAYFTIPGLGADRVMIGGARFDPGYLQQTFFPKVLEELITYKLGEESETPLAMAISSSAPGHAGSSAAFAWTHEGVLASSRGWHTGAPEVARNLDDVFRGLALGIKFQGISVEAIGRNWAYRSFLILGVLSVLLIGGLALTYRSVNKEVALARLKSDFVSNVSHELRTPLSLIRLYAETLELGRIRSAEKMQTYYSTIRLESERLTALIDNILDFSRIEAGRKEYEFRLTDMTELVSHTLATYRAQIDEQGFTFEQRIEPDLPLVRVDREAIARSLVNLVNNALKYSDRERFLSVRLYRTGGEVKLEVADRGIGIARGEQAKIFEKFYRTGDTLVHNTKGSGLGLSLVRHIARAHGGRVEVQSVLGQGSTFTLSLPVDVALSESAGSAA